MGEIDVICGIGTLKSIGELLELVPTVTDMDPPEAVWGTVVAIWVSDHDAGATEANSLPNRTLVLPWAEPKPVPFITTGVPTGPLDGDTEVMMGFGTVNITSLLLETPFTVITAGPLVAPLGTVATIWVSLQLVVEAVVLFKTRVLVPLLVWNPEPFIVTDEPTIPLVGETLLTWGAGTVKSMFAGVLTPPTVTMTAPVVAVEGTVAAICVSDHVTMLAPALGEKVTEFPVCVPKPLPLMWTTAPTGPLAGDKLVITGFGIVNKTSELLPMPFTVTRTGPVSALAGTVTTIWLSLQLTTLARVPPKFTVLDPLVAWKPEPLIVTWVPTIPLVGEMLLTAGGGTLK
jgi:hypothetical protein